MGAAAQELELYGLNTDGAPTLIGNASAAAFFPAYHGAFFIQANGSLNDPVTCLFFEPAPPKLMSKECPR